ncbi:hypothetical protein EVAR_33518_1 [Eumeta japonica]|uniref:Uncharacterized protein n=1 Tax=Eumeta variegata TaxID=151549 RepID=A0A4C1VJK7_EUMVA|nr:hypothetical protein EVAR_33518_1 [Eumeta japonica]
MALKRLFEEPFEIHCNAKSFLIQCTLCIHLHHEFESIYVSSACGYEGADEQGEGWFVITPRRARGRLSRAPRSGIEHHISLVTLVIRLSHNGALIKLQTSASSSLRTLLQHEVLSERGGAGGAGRPAAARGVGGKESIIISIRSGRRSAD